MRHLAKYFIVSILFILSIIRANAQTDNDFWFCIPEVTWQHVKDELTYLHISALEADATVTIEMPLQPKFEKIEVVVPKNTSIEIDLTPRLKKGNGDPDDNNILESGLPGESCKITNKGIHITSTSLITAYLERGHGKHNNCELWALKGQNAYGKNFVVPSSYDYSNWSCNSPKALNGIDIVAIENCEVTVTPSNAIMDDNDNTEWPKGEPRTFKLKKGQTLSLEAAHRGKEVHLGGTIITSNGKIAVQWKDDSLLSTDSGSYDVVGDQIIPNELAGNEYIVMRGQLGEGSGYKSLEYVYIYATQEGTTTVDFATPNGDVLEQIILNGPGEQKHIPLNNGVYNKDGSFLAKDYDALHIKADQKIIVAHVSGFGGEMGAAIIPTIDGCTGSTEVSASVSIVQINNKQDDQHFFLNIMTKKPNIDHFTIEIARNGAIMGPYKIPKEWFIEIPNTGAGGDAELNWYYLSKDYNKFSVDQTTTQGTIPAVKTNDVVKVKNSEGIFHMGVINGGAQGGCRYGYFSDFSDNKSSALVATSGSDYTEFCYGDTITLQATGGVSYSWSYIDGFADWDTFIVDPDQPNVDPKNLKSPKVHPATDFNLYKVRIKKACYITSPYEDLEVQVFGYEPVKADFEIIPDSKCSPANVTIINKSIGTDNYLWTFEHDADNTITSKDPKQTMQVTSPLTYGDTATNLSLLTFTNNSKAKSSYTITLDASFSNACPSRATKSIDVCPVVVADLDASYDDGCQPVKVKFENKTDDSKYTYHKAIWDWGDGSDILIQTGNDIKTGKKQNHTYYNNSLEDKTFYAKLTVQFIDGNDICSSTDSIPIKVYGKVQADYILDKATSCSPLVVTFTNNSIGEDSRTLYTWSLPSNQNITGSVPAAGTQLSASGSKQFTLTCTNNGTDAIQYKNIKLTAVRTARDGHVCTSVHGGDSLTIYPAFSANYEVTNITGCDPLTTIFTNNSNDLSESTHFKWYLGDGTTENSNSQFTHVYAHTLPDIQTYQTALAGENKYGCRDSVAKTVVKVMPYLNPNFTIDKVSGCSPLDVTITNNTPGHASKSNASWNINHAYTTVSGNLDSQATIRFENKTGQTQKVIIKLTDSFTNPDNNKVCSETFEREITIYPEITAKITPDATTICDSTKVTIKNESTSVTSLNHNPTSYKWDFGDGATQNVTNKADITHYYKNSTGSTGTAAQKITTTLIATTGDGCADTVSTDINVYPKVQAIFSADNYSVCSPNDVSIKNESKGASKYVFSFTDGTADKIKSDLTDVVYHITNTSDMIETKKVTLTASNNSCYNTISKVFYAYPTIQPKLAVSPEAGCGPLDVTIEKTGSVGANIFTVDFNDGITDETGNNVIQHTFLNKTGADVTYTVKLTSTNQIGCQASTTKTVTVYPEITSAFNYKKDTECSPMDVTLMNSSTNGSKFIWSFGDGSADETHSDKTDFKHAYVNQSTDGNSISTYTITMTAMDANHNECKDVTSKEIQIYPKVIASFITENNEGCSPLTTTFTNKSKGYGLTYNWNYDHDNAQSANADATHTHTFDNVEASTHTYNIRLITTDVNYCSDTAVMQVRAYPHVTADFSYVKNDACTPYPVTFSYPDVALNGNKFIWDFGYDDNGAIKKDKTPFDFTFDNQNANTVNNYTIQLVSLDTITGCSDTTSQNIEVYPRLLPGFTQDVTEGCNPLTVNFTNQTTGLASYLWDFGDSQSSALTSPEHLFKHYETTDQTYNVKLKTIQNATGCEKTVNQSITTYSYVLAKFGINEKDESANGASSTLLGGCTPFAVNITDSSRLTSAGTWSWDFGDGTTSNSRQPNSLTYTNDDNTAPLENKNYTIKLVVTNDHGCSNDTSQTIAVYPRSVPDFTGDFQGCEPLTVKFIDSSIVDSKTQYYWTFSDGSTIVDKPPFSKTFHNYSYTDDKEYTVNLKTTTEYNCTDEITKTINVYAKPSANFMPLVDRACPPFEAEFTNNSEGTGLSYTWDFGNGKTLSKSTSKANQKVEYSNDTDEPITYNVELITESIHGCLDTMINPMITFPNVIVDFSFDTAGCSPHTIEIKNNSTVTATEHLWEFGDGSTSVAKEPTFTYYNTTNDDQVLTITYIGSSKYQCTDTIQKQVTVYINPNVDFVAHTPSQRYPDDTVYFENYTQDGPWKYKWDFGDGNTSTTDEKYFMYKYGKWGDNAKDNIFHVTLHIESEHCENTATHDVTILPPYPKIAILNNRPSGCVPLTVDFAIEEEYCNTYEWSFEDGSSSTEAEPTHTFTEPGIYNVKLTAEGDGGSHYDYEIITVYELPQPDFTTSPKFVMLPHQPVQFFNSTKNGNTYIWDFGDGTYSTELNPSHQYTVEGLYDVKLIAYSSQMCTDSILKSEEVEVSGAGYIKYPNAFIPSDESPSDGSYPVPDDMNNVFHPIWFGVKEYDLWIFNRWGEQLFHSTDVNVGWNGRYANEGKEMGQDVYFWKAKGKFENNTPFKIAGDVTLIRK